MQAEPLIFQKRGRPRKEIDTGIMIDIACMK